MVIIRGRAQIPPDPAIHDHLRSRVGMRLQEYRVHVRLGFEFTCGRLSNLRPPDLTIGDARSVPRSPARARVIRHVLRFEGSDAHSPIAQVPANRSREPAFTYVGSGAAY